MLEENNNHCQTFQQYVDWAFEKNSGTSRNNNCIQFNEQSLMKTNYFTTQIRDEQMNDIIWLFRKCQSSKELNLQNQAFTDNQHIIRHIFIFLLILVQKKQDNRKIYTLMNSISIFYEDENLKLFIADEKQEILQKSYPAKELAKVEDIFTENFNQILDIWGKLKNSSENCKFQKPKSNKEFLTDFQRINACFNIEQGQKLKELENKKALEKKMKEQKLQEEKLFLSSLRKEQPQFIRLVKVLDLKQNLYFNQSLMLQPNGNFIQGKIWFPTNQPDLCPLWLDYNFQIKSFNNLNNLNQELKQFNGFISYQGPVNDYFEPQTYEYDKDTEGVMKTINPFEEIYKGGFKNGLFEGKNRVYKMNSLIFYGFFKNGQKHGEGYEFDQYSQTYLKGSYESNLKQGLFVDYKLINFQTREKEFSKIGSRIEYYKNSQKYNKVPEQISQVYNVNQNPACTLLNFNEYGINNFQLGSLRPGGWINSSVIDILIQQLKYLVDYSSIMNQSNYGLKVTTLFLNCSQCQDIFGSMITQNDDIMDGIFQDAFKKHLDPSNQEKNQKYDDHMSGQNIIKNIRIVFYLNLDRSHFLSVVYENEKLYLIDSLKDTREPLKIQIRNLLMKYNFYVKDKDDINTYDIKLSQQQNSFDCGVYTIYYISQFIKNQNYTIEQMSAKKCFEISQSKVNYLRYLIYQNLVGNGASIMEL